MWFTRIKINNRLTISNSLPSHAVKKKSQRSMSLVVFLEFDAFWETADNILDSSRPIKLGVVYTSHNSRLAAHRMSSACCLPWYYWKGKRGLGRKMAFHLLVLQRDDVFRGFCSCALLSLTAADTM